MRNTSFALAAMCLLGLGCDEPTATPPAALIANNQLSSNQCSSISDPVRDAFFSPGSEAPAALDILSTSFCISHELTFTIDLAGQLGSLPDPPGSNGALFWTFPLDTDPSTSPQGFPFDPAAPLPPEFIAYAIWDGTSFSGVFLDRRPALTGGQILVYSIPVTVSESRITLTVPAPLAALARALPGARWKLSTGWWDTGLLVQGTNAIHFADGIDWQSWPK